MNDTMELWDSVCETDPGTTKKVTQRGGFTAIDAHAQIKRATELWGPYGDKWGLGGLEWSYVMGTVGPIAVNLDAVFFCPNAPKGFQISGDMDYSPKNDTRKKLQTDLTTKALSKLGFNADVFLGKFDDQRYVNERKKAVAAATEVEDLEKFKDAQTKNFMTAVAGCRATQEQFLFVLGTEGYEGAEEITTSEKRKAFVAALKAEVAKG